MRIGTSSHRTIWRHPSREGVICIIDQRHLPHELAIEEIDTSEGMATAIRDMHLRGAIVIGAAAAYGMHLAALESLRARDFLGALEAAGERMAATRPTAVNLRWAIDLQLERARASGDPAAAVAALAKLADEIAEDEVERSRLIGRHGLELFKRAAERSGGGKINVLTHCNAGWLACVDIGTATAPIYAARDAGLDLHVWVDETRPRNQGTLTAWELMQEGIACTYIPDNSGALLMQRGLVDLVIVGADRVTRRGDVANKIGTHLKALAAREYGVPFYVALPSSTIDWGMADGVAEIPIEQRDASEVDFVTGSFEGRRIAVRVTPEGVRSANFGFDVTPAALITGLVTERGVCGAEESELRRLFPKGAA